jgi:oxygen-independent coproporphyrinogen-3 oxidase
MGLPQRHRLLHGYPLRSAMPRVGIFETGTLERLAQIAGTEPSTEKRLLVGVLPHPFCNPTVRGCGYCTFPHEQFRVSAARSVVDAVIREIVRKSDHAPRAVDGLYLGGGTANLTPGDSMTKLAKTLNTSFDLRQAEITLEGVPVYFLKRERPMDILRGELDARHFRISMGIQTFDEAQLARMGRLAFGTKETFADVASYAQRAGMTVSGDLMFNLPGQSLAAMRDDLRQAVDLELDQICLYHLVLFSGLGTEWSRDASLLDGLPTNREACDHWMTLREELLAAGYVQTTLTNFERRDVNETDRRFIYELCSFQPDRYDMLGFGPSGISFASDDAFTSGWKSTNPQSTSEYLRRVEKTATPHSRFFIYDEHDLRAFYLIRRLAMLTVAVDENERQIDAGDLDDLTAQLAALSAEGLTEQRGKTLEPTPKGMFYADAVASLLVLAQRKRTAAAMARTVSRFSRARESGDVSNMAGYM